MHDPVPRTSSTVVAGLVSRKLALLVLVVTMILGLEFSPISPLHKWATRRFEALQVVFLRWTSTEPCTGPWTSLQIVTGPTIDLPQCYQVLRSRQTPLTVGSVVYVGDPGATGGLIEISTYYWPKGHVSTRLSVFRKHGVAEEILGWEIYRKDGTVSRETHLFGDSLVVIVTMHYPAYLSNSRAEELHLATYARVVESISFLNKTSLGREKLESSIRDTA